MVQISMIIVNMALSMRNDYGSDKDRGPTSCSEKWLTAGSLQEMWENCRLYIKPIAWILCISALHFNENRQRHQATKKDTEVRWQISYAKDYMEVFRINLCERRRKHSTELMQGQLCDTDPHHLRLTSKDL
ncbi:uncharacterized protein LOC144619951 isoform X1 [Crassostrea virginica]